MTSLIFFSNKCQEYNCWTSSGSLGLFVGKRNLTRGYSLLLSFPWRSLGTIRIWNKLETKIKTCLEHWFKSWRRGKDHLTSTVNSHYKVTLDFSFLEPGRGGIATLVTRSKLKPCSHGKCLPTKHDQTLFGDFNMLRYWENKRYRTCFIAVQMNTIGTLAVSKFIRELGRVSNFN